MFKNEQLEYISFAKVINMVTKIQINKYVIVLLNNVMYSFSRNVIVSFVQCVPGFTTENSVLKSACAVETTVRVVMLSQEHVTAMRVGQEMTVHRMWTNVRPI